MVDFCSVKTFKFPRLLVNMSLIFKGILKIQIYHCFYMFIVYTVPLNYLFDEKMNLYKYILYSYIIIIIQPGVRDNWTVGTYTWVYYEV